MICLQFSLRNESYDWVLIIDPNLAEATLSYFTAHVWNS